MPSSLHKVTAPATSPPYTVITPSTINSYKILREGGFSRQSSGFCALLLEADEILVSGPFLFSTSIFKQKQYFTARVMNAPP